MDKSTIPQNLQRREIATITMQNFLPEREYTEALRKQRDAIVIISDILNFRDNDFHDLFNLIVVFTADRYRRNMRTMR